MTRVRILIADDHDVVRKGVRGILESEPGWIVCGEASTGRQAAAMATELQPDVIVLDVSMPDMNGIEAARQIRQSTSAAILFMTMYDSADLERDAIAAGAMGFLSKADSARRLIDAVRSVLARKPVFTHAGHESGAQSVDAGHDQLTPREREVLLLLAEGHTNKQVASRLGITTKTAETHRARIMAKLELHSVSGLVRYALRHRLIDG
jgi:DNA-binding NarL/FixJ family response regulator